MNISRREALQTCSVIPASAVAVATLSKPAKADAVHSELSIALEAAIHECQSLKDCSRIAVKENAKWNLLAAHAGNCQRIAAVITRQIAASGEASPANIQACADSCSQLIMTTHVLASDDAAQSIKCLAACKDACLHWLSMKLA